MQNILFFNSDEILKKHFRGKNFPHTKFVFFNDSINQIENEALQPYDDCQIISVFVHSELIDNKKLDLFSNLKIIATRSTGFNHIDLTYCKKRGISVLNVPSYGEATVAEFTFGLLLNLSRKIILSRDAMACGRVCLDDYLGFDLMGKTIGVIGTGSIGRHVIKLAEGFGMHVLAYDIYPKEDLKQYYVSSLDELYLRADIISLHVPSTRENFHLLNQDAFSKMKNGVLILNTARGDLIDTQALYLALKCGKVAGAGLDVLENEDFLLHDDIITSQKISDSEFLLDSAMNLKLLQFKNVIATPHVAFNTYDAIMRINSVTLENIQSFLKGQIQNKIV